MRNIDKLKEEFNMKTFVKDYLDLCKESGRFCKKHWLGLIIMYLALLGAELGWLFRDDIKDKIKSKFRKEEVEPK